MKFEDDDLKDGKLWAALQKEIDRDLAEKESGETFQEELADIEDSIEFESKETKSEDHIPDETANLSNLRSVLEATERAKDEEAKQKMKQTKVEPVTPIQSLKRKVFRTPSSLPCPKYCAVKIPAPDTPPKIQRL